ncbi:protein-glutamate O-methyltransferase CheR [Oscillatoria sp. FACHB-1406]|uniref:CheR family methyltransferase n=1 Tax=Oscillatoria sp. FACHB-1406 TaxID=2692846 RepID=UPI0016891864|nr:protein-glutamate O-methyltransferase CheR [Oscillatoria sp. FACHB-1406]MBD2579535.1 chemotaxis protein CheR [Oscillatoria sp. FACHB-1406]
MILEAIERLLSQKIGIDSRIIGSKKIYRAAENRRSICRLADLDSYFKVLQTSSIELQELVEQLIVPETYFFRDRKPFDFLINYVRTSGISSSHPTKLRLLSVPCSSGEEPYSMAIALLEAGVPEHRFSIDAIDISKHAIAKAKRAVYSNNSFRGESWVNQNRYFQQTEKGYEVILSVRRTVNFRQGNLLNAFSNTPTKYDIIFCRNLLIYLEPAACQQVLTILERLLVTKGLLFVGASETAKIPSDCFTSIRQSFTFAYQKVERTQERSPQIDKTSIDELEKSSHLADNSSAKILTDLPSDKPPETPAIAFPSSVFEQRLQPKRSMISEPVSESPKSSLSLAIQLADTGQIEAAIEHCQEYLKSDFTNVEAHTLLGTLYQTKAEYTQAEQYFRKALYLNPNHYEALMYLALLKEHRGDIAGAKILQQRIQKLQLASKSS